MKGLIVLLSIGAACGLAYVFWLLRQRWEERQEEEARRASAFLAQVMPAVPGAVTPAAAAVAAIAAAPKIDPAALQHQQLLFDAATKAGLAGEPALSIQLYARLVSRFPDTALAAQARSAVEAQKKKLVKT